MLNNRKDVALTCERFQKRRFLKSNVTAKTILSLEITTARNSVVDIFGRRAGRGRMEIHAAPLASNFDN
jgi:hypothetical protein